MKSQTLIVVVKDPDFEELTVLEAVTRYHRTFSVNEMASTYDYGDRFNIPIGEDTGKREGIIGVFDKENPDHTTNLNNALDALELQW